jgi:hypothetical protein
VDLWQSFWLHKQLRSLRYSIIIRSFLTYKTGKIHQRLGYEATKLPKK